MIQDRASDSASRQQKLYWLEMEQAKASSVCIRLYRNRLGKWVRVIELVRAVASSTSIAAWAVWKDYPIFWAAIIALAQIVDATKHVLPVVRHHRSASELTVALELLFIDAQLEWEKIYTRPASAAQIMESCARLRRLRVEAERKHFPEGFAPDAAIVAMATTEAKAYFARMESVEVVG